MIPQNARDARQQDAALWVIDTFGPQAMDPWERARRFFEEATELVQATGLDRDTLVRIIDVVYARPVGEPAQELGGVGLTLLALAQTLHISADKAERDELLRVHLKSGEHFRARQREKAALGVSQEPALVSAYKPLDASRLDGKRGLITRYTDDELCENCGMTYAGHISNTGVVHPDWKPSGTFKAA